MDRRVHAALVIAALAACCAWLALTRQHLGLALLAAALVVLLGTLPRTPLRSGMIVAVSVLATLAVVEVSFPTVRALALGAGEDNYFDPTSDYARRYWKGSVFGSQPRPGVATSRKLTGQGELIYDVKYSIGEDGFRITPDAGAGTDGQINFLGCSYTFGEGLADAETFPNHVARLLPGYRVKNYAMHGWGVHQALAVLESIDDPARINFLLTVPWHADRSACVPFYSIGSPRYVLDGDGRLRRDGVCGETWHRLPWPVRSMFTRSNLYQFVSTRLLRDQDREIDLYLAIIKRIRDLSAERGARLVVGFIKAEAWQFNGRYSNERIVEILRGWDIPVIDMTLATKAEQLPRQFYLHPHDRHPSAAANRERAALLARYLAADPAARAAMAP